MTNILLNSSTNGHWRKVPIENVNAADRLLKARENSSVWEVLEEVIKVWIGLRPLEYQSSIIDLEQTRQILDDPKFGSSKGTKGTGDLRRTLDVPVFVEMVMRRLYTVDELPFDKKWYTKLWDKVPMFRVSEKR